MAAVDLAKKQAMLDSVLTTNIADMVSPALQLMNRYAIEQDYLLYNAGSSAASINISSFEEGSSGFYTRCQTNAAGMMYLQDGSEISIATGPYTGYYRVGNIDTLNYTFEIHKIFSTNTTATAILTRYSTLEYSHAFFILHLLATAAHEMVEKKVVYTSQGFGDGNIQKADITAIQDLARMYKRKAIEYLSYNNCGVI